MVGIDIIDITRIEDAAKKASFVNHVYSETELLYISQKSDEKLGKPHSAKMATMAGMYAAKEAALKALKTGIGKLALKDITVDHEEGGAPFIILSKKAEKVLKSFGKTEISLSISHDGDYATAVCVIV